MISHLGLIRTFLKFHPLKGDKKNLYAITVRANWRITFEFTDGDAYILNLEDYH